MTEKRLEQNTIMDSLTDIGFEDEKKREANALYEAGQLEELIRYLKKCRCGLMDEMHESQRKVDRMDYLIRRTENELAG